jgi:hypothetical protein
MFDERAVFASGVSGEASGSSRRSGDLRSCCLAIYDMQRYSWVLNLRDNHSATEPVQQIIGLLQDVGYVQRTIIGEAPHASVMGKGMWCFVQSCGRWYAQEAARE